MAPLPDLSVQLYSVRRPLAYDFAGTIDRLAEIGLTRVEPYGLLDYAHQLDSALSRAGLTAPTAHQDLTGGRLDEIFHVAAALGVDTVVHPHSPRDCWQSRDDVRRLADQLAEAASVAAAGGVRVAYHNHDWELTTQLDGRPALEVFADLVEPTVLVQVDAYWAAVGGQDVPALLRRLGEKVVALHLKDGPLNGDTALQLPLGSGDLPAAEVVAAAGAVQFLVLEFDDYAGDIFEGIEASYAYAVGTLGAVR